MGCVLSYAKELFNMGESGDTPVTVAGSNTDGRTISETGSGPTASKTAKVFTFRELATATKDFRSKFLLGQGGFGRVYKGQLRNGQEVAVKLLDRSSQQGDQEFFAEVEMLSLLHHPNLVTLIGYCSERDQRVLVYEYMPLGSLDDHLYDVPVDKAPLDWKTRMKIANGVAKGLEYLHVCADQPVIFRDFKPSNILLGEGYHPVLSDFGVAKFGPVGDSNHVSTRVVGTYGYCAPEYMLTGHLTPKCDVYGFGVVLLELISGRKVIDKTRSPDMRNLVMWAQPIFKDPNQFYRLVDPLLPGWSIILIVAISMCCIGRKGSGLDKLEKKRESKRGNSGCAADTGRARETPGNPEVKTQPAVEERGEKLK
ncbi:hypothetical protein VNO80_22760 [Phaseolus coccineus]|uniref:non-specific serine/threonine protein kinase n=1 Tax=Phaseolus coccineus TaxID=3886 RepID=A0AAN9M4Q5_PHACN